MSCAQYKGVETLSAGNEEPVIRIRAAGYTLHSPGPLDIEVSASATAPVIAAW